jgi:hypothetical protein
MLYIFVTVLVSQVFMAALVESDEAFWNIEDILVTPLRSGASTAEIVRLLHPLNALAIEVQAILPHWEISRSLRLSPPFAKYIRGNVPLIRIVLVPADP